MTRAALALAACALALAPLARAEALQDAPFAPVMQVLAPGGFERGPPRARQHVRIAYPLAVSRYAVTFDQWDACVRDGGCGGYSPDDFKWGRGDQPVINVDWRDAQAYAGWLSRRTGRRYRLLSEAEFEYAARGGTTTLFWWGDEVGQGHANCLGCGSRWDNDRAAPVGSFAPNPFGLYDTAGNVWSWTADCWNDSYRNLPADGRPARTGTCGHRVVRGGSWNFIPKAVWPSTRNWYWDKNRSIDTGFRIAREMAPPAPGRGAAAAYNKALRK